MSSSYRLLWPVAIAIGLLGAAPALAGTIDLSIQSVSASAPSVGNNFEVDLTNNTVSAVVIDAFSFGLSANSNIIFTSATTATVNHAYIFAGAGNSFDVLFNGGIVSNSAGAGFLTANDLWFGAGNGFSVGAGVEVGLGEVFFNVAPSAAGPYVVSFVSDTSQTSLSDFFANLIPIGNETSGTITTPAAATPEPSTLTLFGLAIALLAWARKPLVGNRTLRG
jgi:hypothetical protein